MGFYIEVPKPRQKAQQLVDVHNARIETGKFFDPTGERVGICVVENGPFDAAGIAFNAREAEEFAYEDGRPRTWLSMPREAVVKACPQVESLLP
jgi:hypothetical protein